MIYCRLLIFDLFDLVIVQADAKRTLNGLDRYNQCVRTLHSDQNPFHPAEGATLHPNALTNIQERVVLDRNSAQKNGSDRFDLLIGDPGGDGVLADKADYSRSTQYAYSIGCQISNPHESISREQGELDVGPAITPLPHRANKRKEYVDALRFQFPSRYFFMP